MLVRIRIKEKNSEEEIIEPGPWQIIEMERQYGVDAKLGVEVLAFLVYQSIHPSTAQFRKSVFDRWARSLEICERVPTDDDLLKIECDCGRWMTRSLEDIVRDTFRYAELHDDDEDTDDDDSQDQEPLDPKAG